MHLHSIQSSWFCTPHRLVSQRYNVCPGIAPDQTVVMQVVAAVVSLQQRQYRLYDAADIKRHFYPYQMAGQLAYGPGNTHNC